MDMLHFRPYRAEARATGAYSSLASVFAEIAAADPKDARRRGFVFLATHGAAMYDGKAPRAVCRPGGPPLS